MIINNRTDRYRTVKYWFVYSSVACLGLFMVLMVIATYDGCSCAEVEEEKMSVYLGNPFVVDGQDNGGPHWDVTIDVYKIRPKDKRAIWTDVRIIIKSASGEVLVPASILEPDAPSEYDDGLHSPIEVQFWFIDSDGDNTVDAGDAVKITGISPEFGGAWVILTRAGEQVSAITLPTELI
jgi:hypothetical protein